MQISKIYIDNSILLCYNVFEVKGKDKALSKNSYKGEKNGKSKIFRRLNMGKPKL